MDLARRHRFPVPRVHEVRPDALVLERIAGPSMGSNLRRHRGSARDTFAPWRTCTRGCTPFRTKAAGCCTWTCIRRTSSSRGGAPVVIDWTNADAGDPAQDMALSWLILETSAGLPGRLLARLFAREVGRDTIRRGIADASAFRIADPHVTDAERARVPRAVP